MSNVLPNLKYTTSDEWFDPASGKAGLTDFAQGQLSDIVFVEILVAAGDTVEVGTPIASVESVKAAAETFSPVAGKVVAINSDLSAAPETLNSDPFGAGWMVQIEGADSSSMLDAAAYEKDCEGRAH